MTDVLTLVVKWVIQFAPFGIMGLVFTAVSESGMEVFTTYGALVLLLVGCMLFNTLILNPLWSFIATRQNPYPLLWTCLKESGLQAFFTRSSAANIPINMGLCKKLGLDEDFYSVSIPLGATINMNGGAVTITVMTMCVAYTLGIEVGFIPALLLSVVATMGACGASGVAGGSLLLVPMAHPLPDVRVRWRPVLHTEGLKTTVRVHERSQMHTDGVGIGADALVLVDQVGVFDHFAVVGFYVFPVVEGVAVGLDGDGGFVLVHQEFDQDVLAAFFAEEDPLDVGAHGDEAEDGEGEVQVLHVVGGTGGFGEAQGEGKGKHHAVVAEAEAKGFAAIGDDFIGLVQEVLKERINAVVGLLGTRHQAFPQAPGGVVGAESVDHAFLSKDIVKVDAEFGEAVHIGRHIIHVVGEGVRVDKALSLLHVGEHGFHLGTPGHHFLAELLQFVVEFVVQGCFGQHDGFVGLEIDMVLFPGGGGNLVARVQNGQFLTEVLHTLDYAAGSGSIGRYGEGLLHQGRIVVKHPAGDGFVLPCAQGGKGAGAAFGIARCQDDTVAHVLSVFREKSQRQRAVQLFVKALIGLVTGHIPGTVTAVMADIERLIPSRCRRDVTGRRRVSGIIAGRKRHVGQQFLAGGLCTCAPTQQQKAQKE